MGSNPSWANMKDHCDECGGKPGGHKPYCSERFKNKETEVRRNQMQSYGMEVVKVDKEDLLKILCSNRDEHREIFLEALDGYHKAALKALQDRVNEAKENKRVSLRFRLEEPQDQTKQYDRIIKMLKMSVDKEVRLTQQEFANYVMDDWSWMDQFLTSNSGYSAKAATKFGNR